MLSSLVINLQASQAMKLSAYLGRASHQLFFSILPPDLATELHETQQTKPFTVSNLMMGQIRGRYRHIAAGESGWLRFTGLTTTVSEALLAFAHTYPQSLTLDRHPFTVTGLTFDPRVHAWANVVSYQDLAAAYLLGQDEPLTPRLSLTFNSPTTFRTEGKYLPLPLPQLVFGSLFNRWQAFAPIGLSSDFVGYVEALLGLNDYKVRSVAWPSKGKGQLIGFVGTATFTSQTNDPYWLSLLHLLRDFALFSGVGYQTTSGLGQVRGES